VSISLNLLIAALQFDDLGIMPVGQERAYYHCGKPYRGPAVYCSLACALADA
jgi:hypothetical protein